MLSFGFSINESDKCVYPKFERGKGVIIFLNVDDMLSLGTDLEEVDKMKNFRPSKFSMNTFQLDH